MRREHIVNQIREIVHRVAPTAQAMLETKRFLYVGFMCHQVIEKMLKAYWSNVLEEPALKIHSLSNNVNSVDFS